MKKKIIALLCALVLTLSAAVSLAGCRKKKVAGEITIWWPGTSVEMASINKAKEQYEALNEGVTIKVIPQSTTNFYMQYNLALDGEDYPDIAYVDHVYVQQLAYPRGGKSKIVNFTKAGIDDIESSFIESLIAPNKMDGEVYALPFSTNTLVMVYNKTLLKEVLGRDVTDADIPKTYSELKAISTKILDYNKAHSKDYVPFTVPAGNTRESMGAMAYLSYVAREGGTVISDDLKTMKLNEGPAEAAATKIAELGASYGVPATFEEGAFEGGKVAFIEMGNWKINEYEQIGRQKNIEFGYAPVVSFKDGVDNISGLGLYSLVATEKSINRDISIDFIKWLTTNDEIQLLHNKPQCLMPTTKTALQDSFYTGDVWSIYKEQLNKVVARPGSPEWAEMERQFAGFVTALLNGSRSPSYVRSLNAVLQSTLDELYEE